MEIILKQDVNNLGHKDDIVVVKNGYATNYLIPQGFAIMATPSAKKVHAEEKQKQLERFLMNVAEAADAALWEYWREKEAEHRRFATEYVTRRGLIPQQ